MSLKVQTTQSINVNFTGDGTCDDEQDIVDEIQKMFPELIITIDLDYYFHFTIKYESTESLPKNMATTIIRCAYELIKLADKQGLTLDA